MLGLFIFLFLIQSISSDNIDINVDTSNPIHTLREKFVSVTIDSGNAQHFNWSGMNFTYDEIKSKNKKFSTGLLSHWRLL